MLLDATSDARDLSDALERGRVVRFSRCPVQLPAADDLAFLRGLGERLSRKNVSYYPERDRLVGLDEPAARTRAAALLQAHGERVRAFLTAAMPSFMAGATPGTTSFRPLEERGRNLSAHASNELIHVDAGAYGATHGDRILRFFVNCNETDDRVWASKGTFRQLYDRYAREAGLRGRVYEGPLDRARTGLLRALGRAAPALRMIDSSPYDRQMRRFHNFMKDAPAFRDSTEGQVELRFPPGSAWMCLTDAVSHACLSGRHALVDTLLVPLANCRVREEAPFEILARHP